MTGDASSPVMDELLTDDLFRAAFPGAEVRDVGDGVPVLSVPIAPFTEWTVIDSASEGRFLERWTPEAFSASFDAVVPKAMFQHGRDPELGEKLLGSQVELRDGAYEVPLFPSIPPLLLDGLRAGAYGSSFRFGVPPGGQDVTYRPKRSDHNPEGLPERTVTGGIIREFGPVTFPAYAGATAGVRSLTDDFRPRDTNQVIAEMAREHPKELAAVIQEALKGSEAARVDPKPQSQPRFRSREEFLAWM